MVIIQREEKQLSNNRLLIEMPFSELRVEIHTKKIIKYIFTALYRAK